MVISHVVADQGINEQQERGEATKFEKELGDQNNIYFLVIISTSDLIKSMYSIIMIS